MSIEREFEGKTVTDATTVVARSAHGADLGSGAAVRHKRSGMQEPATQMIGTVATTANGSTIPSTLT